MKKASIDPNPAGLGTSSGPHRPLCRAPRGGPSCVPPNPYVEALSPRVMVFGGGAWEMLE